MEIPRDVDDIPGTRLTRKNVRTLDTWRVHLQHWEPDRLITRSEQCEVRMKMLRSMLNYGRGTTPKDRWLNDEVIVAYASLFEQRWSKVLGAIHFQSFYRTGQFVLGLLG